jgi:hypothetical protein
MKEREKVVPWPACGAGPGNKCLTYVTHLSPLYGWHHDDSLVCSSFKNKFSPVCRFHDDILDELMFFSQTSCPSMKKD